MVANGKKIDGDETLYSTLGNPVFSDDDLEEVNTSFCKQILMLVMFNGNFANNI